MTPARSIFVEMESTARILRSFKDCHYMGESFLIGIILDCLPPEYEVQKQMLEGREDGSPAMLSLWWCKSGTSLPISSRTARRGSNPRARHSSPQDPRVAPAGLTYIAWADRVKRCAAAAAVAAVIAGAVEATAAAAALAMAPPPQGQGREFAKCARAQSMSCAPA